MASKKLGNLIKTARTEAGLTQEALAKKISGLSASDISKAERGEGDLTQDQLKKIAKATGVTQASLLNAAKGTTAKTTSAKSTARSTSKSTTAKSTAAKKTASKTTAAKTASTKTASTVSMRVTASEKKIVEAFRDADTDQKKAALYILKGESADLVDDILRKHGTEQNFTSILENIFGGLLGK